MALQTIPGNHLVYPGINLHGGNVPALQAGTSLDAAGEYASAIINAAEDMLLSHIGIKLATATGSPTLDIRTEGIDSSGFGSGTLWAANTNIVTGALSTTFGLHALTAPASILKGQDFCVKFLYNSGTVAAPTNINAHFGNRGKPYFVGNTSGAPVKAAFAARSLVLGGSVSAFYPVHNFLPVASIAQNAFNNTNGAKRGIRFQVPFKCSIAGIRYYLGTATGNYNIAILDDAGTELGSSSTACVAAASSGLDSNIVDQFFDNGPVTLEPLTWYRAVIEPTSSTNVNMYTATLPGADYRKAWPGGENYYYTTFASAVWDDSLTTQVPFMDLLIRKLDDGVGSGNVARVIGG